MMNWTVLSYSLPSQSSTPRVTLWRRLRRLGTISPTDSVYILPARDECVEAFQWLAQEIRQAQGEALVMHVRQFEGLTDSQLIEFFCQARHEEYTEIAAQLVELEQHMEKNQDPAELPQRQGMLDKLHKQYSDVVRIDYFQCPQGPLVAAQLGRVAQRLSPTDPTVPQIEPAAIARYRDKRWVTRPRPHVDRLACAWLIRRFINPDAIIRYARQPEPDEVAFDMEAGQFGHQGNLCTFETMIRAFNLNDSGLPLMAEIVHEIDLRDGRYQRLETAGIDAVLQGWLLAGLPDAQLESQGIILFEGLFTALSHYPHVLL